MYKIGDYWVPTAQHRELCSELCGELDWKEIQKRGDGCINMADLFCYTTETNNNVVNLYSNVVLLQLYSNNFFLKI